MALMLLFIVCAGGEPACVSDKQVHASRQRIRRDQEVYEEQSWDTGSAECWPDLSARRRKTVNVKPGWPITGLAWVGMRMSLILLSLRSRINCFHGLLVMVMMVNCYCNFLQ